MRIAYDARPMTVRKTGIGRYVQGILEALLAHGELEDMFLLSPRAVEKGALLSRDPRVKERIQRGWLGNVWLQMMLPVTLRSVCPDLFHATLFVPPLCSRIPSVVNIYDLTVYRYPESMERRNRLILRLLLPKAVQRAERIITLSEFTKKEIEERWPEASSKIAVVPGAPYATSPLSSADTSLPAEEEILSRYGVQKPYLLSVGTLEPRKNVVRLIETFELLHRMGERDLQLVLVGGMGWETREIVRALKTSPVRSALRWIGYIPDEDMTVIYRHAQIFVCLSLYEGFGFPPLEAMSAGTCVVGSEGGSLSEVLKGAAIMVDPLNPEAAAQAIGQALRDEELRTAYAQKGLAHSAGFSWEESAEKTMQVYREIVQPGFYCP